MAKNNGAAVRMARGMGALSLGFGLPAIAAPDALARAMGLRNDSTSRTVLTLVGVRETALGLAILAWPRFAGWMWARVAGDAMDLTFLGVSLAASDRRHRNPLARVMAITGSITALDLGTAIGLSRRKSVAKLHGGDHKPEAKRAITVNRPPEQLYQTWRDFQNLPRFMENLVSVEPRAGNRSHWVAKAPAGATVEWDAEIVEDQPNNLIAWRSLPGSQVETTGAVRFVQAPGGKGTEIHVEMRYDPPGGRLGAAVAKIFGKEPGQQIASDLRRFKQVMETGEIARSDASARGGGAAQPLKQTELPAAANLAVVPALS
jgi:uncharacterized membrane protein